MKRGTDCGFSPAVEALAKAAAVQSCSLDGAKRIGGFPWLQAHYPMFHQSGG